MIIEINAFFFQVLEMMIRNLEDMMESEQFDRARLMVMLSTLDILVTIRVAKLRKKCMKKKLIDGIN